MLSGWYDLSCRENACRENSCRENACTSCRRQVQKVNTTRDDHGEIKLVHLTVPYMLEQGLAKQEILGKVQAWRAGLDAAE